MSSRKKSIYFDTDVNLREIGRVELSDFMGVDYDSTPLKVATSRASKMQNLIFKNGANHKRNGWVEKFKLPNSGKINGMWNFKDSYGKHHLIIHSGSDLYRVEYANLDNPLSSVYTRLTVEFDDGEILDRKSWGVVRGNRLYILCGKYCVYGTWDKGKTWELKKVTDTPDMYIPVTTIGIRDTSVPDTRVSYEEVNLLTPFRKNTFYMPDIMNVNNPPQYYFDSKISNYNKDDILDNKDVITIYNLEYIKIKNIELRIKAKIDINGNLYTFTAICDVRRGGDGNYTRDYIVIREFKDCPKYIVEDDMFIYKVNDFVGYFTEDHFVIDRVFHPQNFGTPGITLLYAPNISYFDKKSVVDKCQFGCLFGYNEIEDLFISGNPDFPNYDYHSSIGQSREDCTLSIEEDLTYFGDLSYTAVGNSTTKITGYSRLEDNTLGIHKEKSYVEPSFFLRTSSYVKDESLSNQLTVTNESGQITQTFSVYKVQYATFSSTIGEGLMSYLGVCNFCGDNVMLSNHGLYGIQMASNIKTNERTARERSRLVNNIMCKEENLDEAVLISYDNKLFIGVNGNVYIADARFSTTQSQEMDDTFSYEFWVWNNVPVRIWGIVDGYLAFGTETGEICIFDDEKNFIDKKYLWTEIGGITLDFDKGALTVNEQYGMQVGDIIEIQNSIVEIVDGQYVEREILFEKVLDISEITIKEYLEDGYYVRCDAELYYLNIVPNMNSTIKVLAGNVEQEITFKVDIDEYDYPGNFRLLVVDGDFSKFNINQNNITFVSPLKESEIYGVIPENNGAISFGIRSIGVDLDDDEELDYYGKSKELVCIKDAPTLTARIHKFQNVKCVWMTPVMDCGTSLYLKNIREISIVPDAETKGDISFGIITKKGDFEINAFASAQGVDLWDLNDFTFKQFTFDASFFTRAYTKRVHLKDINFIQLGYHSDNDRDCVVHSLTATYYLSKKNRGVF